MSTSQSKPRPYDGRAEAKCIIKYNAPFIHPHNKLHAHKCGTTLTESPEPSESRVPPEAVW